MFDLEKNINDWIRQFRKHRAFNTGAIREMELHLRDHVDDLINEGLSEQQAFEKAITEFGSITPMAKEAYWSQRPKSRNNSIINTTMLKNYFKIAVRNFAKHKFYTFVNVMGLTMGLAIVFLIGLFVNDELSFDKFHVNKDHLYRVVENQYYAGQPVFPVAVTPTALAPSLVEEYPEIVNATRGSYNNYRFKNGDQTIFERGGIMVDEAFFDMFSFPLISGTTEDFKENLNALVLTKELADKYFPNKDALGQSIRLEDEEFDIVAVMEDVPKNSHLPFKYLVNFEKFLSDNPRAATSWGSNSLYTYVQLAESADFDAINAKIEGQIKKNNESSVVDLYLQPLPEIYLGEVDFTVEAPRKGEQMYVNVFSIVAVFILIISCINFMNLSTARSAKRAKEVGLRKTIGAKRSQLIFQFLSESVLLSMLAITLSIGLVALLLPSFNQLTDKEFYFMELINSDSIISIAIGILVVALATGLFAGSYPALFLSSIKPVLTLKTQSISIKQGAGLRKVLVVFQFIISLVLIIGTITIYQQLKFIQSADLGYNKENIIYTSAPSSQSKVLASELRNDANVINVGLSNRHPAYVMSSSSGFAWPGQNPDETILIHFMGIDENYMATMEMEMLDGREFLAGDTSVVIINEKAKEIMGLDEPVGVTMDAYGDRRIVGVVKDFNFKSIHTTIEPIIIFKLDQMSQVYVKYQDGQEAEIVSSMENAWNKVFPDRDFSYTFLQNDFDDLYSAEERTSKLSTYFAVLAIIISCLGLFGLVSYAMEQRMKEIGIRKALGASINSLFGLLTKDFAKLILIAMILSIPLGWYTMDKWLEGFAYRVDLSWWIFALTGFAGFAITLLTVSYQSIRASQRNPVRALRHE